MDMDLQRAYAAMGRQDQQGDDLLRAAMQHGTPSQHPLAKLRKALLWNLFLSAVVTLSLGCLMYVVQGTTVRVLLGLVLVFCVWAIMDALRLVRNWKGTVSPTNNLLHEMQRQEAAITRWMRLQMRISIFVYPIAGASGFLWGGMSGSGKDAVALMDAPYMWLILTITLVVLVPLCYLLAKWTFKAAFGRHLEDLRERIAELTR